MTWLLAASLLWAFSFGLIKRFLPDLDPWWVAAVRLSLATAAFAPLAEYAWGHFPRGRGTTSFGSWRTNPYVRAFVVFPAAVFVVGVLVLVAWTVTGG